MGLQTFSTPCDRNASIRSRTRPTASLPCLKRNDGAQFDQHLVRRFVQLIGIYPAGNLVQLDTGEVAVVVEAYARRIPIDRRSAWCSTRVVTDCPSPTTSISGKYRQSVEVLRRFKAPSIPPEYDIDPLNHVALSARLS